MKSLALIRARTEKNASLRSDDFGHDCQALLVAESDALQVAADDIARLIVALEKCVEQRDGYLEQCNTFGFMNRKNKCDAELEQILEGK